MPVVDVNYVCFDIAERRRADLAHFLPIPTRDGVGRRLQCRNWNAPDIGSQAQAFLCWNEFLEKALKPSGRKGHAHVCLLRTSDMGDSHLSICGTLFVSSSKKVDALGLGPA